MTVFNRKLVVGRVGLILAIAIIRSPSLVEYRARLFYAGFRAGRPILGTILATRLFEVLKHAKPFRDESVVVYLLRLGGIKA